MIYLGDYYKKYATDVPRVFLGVGTVWRFRFGNTDVEIRTQLRENTQGGPYSFRTTGAYIVEFNHDNKGWRANNIKELIAYLDANYVNKLRDEDEK